MVFCANYLLSTIFLYRTARNQYSAPLWAITLLGLPGIVVDDSSDGLLPVLLQTCKILRALPLTAARRANIISVENLSDERKTALSSAFTPHGEQNETGVKTA